MEVKPELTERGRRTLEQMENGMIPHPLQNRVVMRQIFTLRKDFTFKELRVLRLVSPVWKEECLRLWRASACLRVYPDPEPTNNKIVGAALDPGNGVSVSELCDLFQNDEQKLQSIPFTCYKFKHWNLDLRISTVESRYFWDNVGPFIERLHFEQCTSTTAGTKGFQDIVFRELTNLQHLKLSDNSFTLPPSKWWTEENRGEIIPYNNEESARGNLKELDLEGIIPFNVKELCKFFPKVESFRFNDTVISQKDWVQLYYSDWNWITKLESLKHVDVMHGRDNDNFRQSIYQGLWHCRQGFESLALQLDHDERADTFLSFFLGAVMQNNSNRAKILKVFRKPFSIPYTIFPFGIKMNALEELHLWGSVAGDLKFLEQMPKLKKLYINHGCFELRKEILARENLQERKMKRLIRPVHFVLIAELWFKANERNNLQMEHLTYVHVDIQFPAECLYLMASWFNNLKQLHLIVRKDRQLMVISELWSELEELHLLYGSEITDEMACKYLPKLSSLTHFSLSTKCDEGKLTDRSVEQGFMRMPTLTNLKLCVSSEMTQAGENSLKEKIKEVAIIRNYGEGHSEECCLRKEFESEAFQDVSDVFPDIGEDEDAEAEVVQAESPNE